MIVNNKKHKKGKSLTGQLMCFTLRVYLLLGLWIEFLANNIGQCSLMRRVVRNKNKENWPSSSEGDRCTVKKVLSYRQMYGILLFTGSKIQIWNEVEQYNQHSLNII